MMDQSRILPHLDWIMAGADLCQLRLPFFLPERVIPAA